jgi:hypothetical protein
MGAGEAEDLERIARAIGEGPERLEWAGGHGAPSNRRYIVRLHDRSVFAKVAAFDYTAEWLRREHEIYRFLAGQPFVPHLLGWDDDGVHPVLVVEDLSGARWPPPWRDGDVDAVLDALELIHAVPPPASLEGAEDLLPEVREGWKEIRDDPEPVLGLGMFSEEWLARHVGVLEDAADAAVISGDAFVHFDVRSDNLCLRDGSAVLIDWNWACLGDPGFDVAAWLPSLAAEGGPHPMEVMPDAAGFASILSGFFLSHCVQEPIPQAPHVRARQEECARVALPWAVYALGLPPPGMG